MTVEIRRATPSDADVVARLNHAVQEMHASALPWRFKTSAGHSTSSAIARDLLADPEAIVFLAYRGDAPCGYAYATITRRPESAHSHAYTSLYLHHLSVEASERRTGVGSRLLNAVHALAAERGHLRVELDVWTFNDTARAFFKKHGFAVYNERMWKA